MDTQTDKHTSEYIWSLAEQRRRADDGRSAMFNELVDGLGRRLRCSITGLLGRHQS